MENGETSEEISGATRADIHLFGFYIYSFPLLLALAALPLNGRMATIAAWLAVGFCPFGANAIGPTLMTNGAKVAWHGLVSNPSRLWHIAEWRRDFIRDWNAESGNSSLRSEVGNRTIDILNLDQRVALTSRLHVDFRPVFQSYTAYTPALMEANSAFYESTCAPAMVRVRLDTIDDRYPGQDDSLVLAQLLRRYDLVKEASDYVLFARRAAQPQGDMAKRLVETHVPKFGDVVNLPVESHPLWIQIQCRPTLLGRLRAFLYHSAKLSISLTGEDGRVETYRVIPGSAQKGFIIQPWLRSHLDLAALAKGHANSRVQSFRFETDGGDGLFWKRPKVALYSLDWLPLE